MARMNTNDANGVQINYNFNYYPLEFPFCLALF